MFKKVKTVLNLFNAHWSHYRSKENFALVFYFCFSLFLIYGAYLSISEGDYKILYKTLLLISFVMFGPFIFMLAFSTIHTLTIRSAGVRYNKEPFINLSEFYKNIKITAFENLHLKKKKIISTKPARNLFLINEECYIFGYFDENMTFDPYITEKITELHEFIASLNILMKDRDFDKCKDISIKVIQYSLFLEKVFKHLEEKRKSSVNKNLSQENLDNIFNSLRDEFHYDLKEIYLQSKINLKKHDFNFLIKNFSWLTYNIKEDKNSGFIHDYYLPGEYKIQYEQKTRH